MDEAGVVAADDQRRQRAAGHGHQRIDRHQTADGVQCLRRHNVEAEPAHGQNPGAQRQKGNARGRMRRHAAVAVIAPPARTHQQHGRQRDPAAHRMHHDGPGEVMKGRAITLLQPGLQAEIGVPGDTLEQGIHQSHQQECRGDLRIEAGAFGNAAGNDGRNRRRERQQEKEFHQAIAVLGHQLLGPREESDAVGQGITDEEIGNGRHREVDQDLNQRIHLILAPHRAQFQEGKTRMHGQYHDGAQQNEQNVLTFIDVFHGSRPRVGMASR